jgi:hypothetical protein
MANKWKRIRWSFKYATVSIKHKWHMFKAARTVGGVGLWRVLKHDVSKFSFSELPHYGQQFFGEPQFTIEWEQAWLHHQNRNDHHWEYWIPRKRLMPSGCRLMPEAIRMPSVCVREMVADWLAASKAHTGDWWMGPWLVQNFHKMHLHPQTQSEIRGILGKLGYEEL